MTDQEREIVRRIGQVWDAYLTLPVEHADDTNDFRHGIHALQRMVLARPARREINGAWSDEAIQFRKLEPPGRVRVPPAPPVGAPPPSMPDR